MNAMVTRFANSGNPASGRTGRHQPWIIALLLACASPQLAAAPVGGEVTEFQIASGLTERCVRIAPFPGAHYSKHDQKAEARYCALDLERLALCPKLWSTSPGTILYEIDAAAYDNDFAAFERQHCASGHHAKQVALDEPAVYKMSVNARDTSATYAPSSWVYYHLSRYFRSNVRVPVAVYRSMDARAHNDRVVKPALKIVGDRRVLGMLRAGWRFLDAVETGQMGGAAAGAVLTDENRQVFGVLINNKGDRYGAEINGTRESGWGSGQNHDFQQTAPFLALRSGQPIAEAASAAIHEARKNPRMAKALPADTPVLQVVFWMQDILEITLLDFMLGQQDRIGNIDYNWRWFWVEDGELKSKSAHGRDVPADLAAFEPARLRQSAINDNDAGVRPGYADFAMKTHMLEGLRHYDPALYARLGRLAADLGDKGPAYQWLTKQAGLSEREADTIAERAGQAFALLQADCASGALKLDLDIAAFLAGQAPAGDGQPVSCEVGPS
jgi:hypothetical protein